MKKTSQTSTISTAPVKADTAKTASAAKPKARPKARPKASATKSETTPKANPARTTPKASTSSKVKAPAKTKVSTKQSPKDLLLNQDNDLPDLNIGTGYPTHPNRIWPD